MSREDKIAMLKLLIGFLLVAISIEAMPAERSLKPPAGFSVPVRSLDKDVRPCAEGADPFSGELDFPSKYRGSDKARDDLNKKADAEYKKKIAPIRNMERAVNQQIEDYMRSGKQPSLNCALELLRAWSSAGALMGKSKSHTGKSMRKRALGTLASSWLRLKFSPSQPLMEHAVLVAQVESWFDMLAKQVVIEWSNQPLKKMNNHEYWAAWSVMATAVALDEWEYFYWALKQYQTGTAQIDPDGFLPNELSRDTRALYYHNYALTPLVMLAAFAEANGEAIDAADQQALYRLSERVLIGVDDPTAFQEKTSKVQNMTEFESSSKFAWMEIYCATLSCDETRLQRLAELRPLKNYRLGGNLTELFGPSMPRSSSFQEALHIGVLMNE